MNRSRDGPLKRELHLHVLLPAVDLGREGDNRAALAARADCSFGMNCAARAGDSRKRVDRAAGSFRLARSNTYQRLARSPPVSDQTQNSSMNGLSLQAFVEHRIDPRQIERLGPERRRAQDDVDVRTLQRFFERPGERIDRVAAQLTEHDRRRLLRCRSAIGTGSRRARRREWRRRRRGRRRSRTPRS